MTLRTLFQDFDYKFLDEPWGLLIIIILFLLIWRFPRRQTYRARYNSGEIRKDELWEPINEFRKTLIQVLGGGAIIAGVFLSWHQFNSSQQNILADQIASRYNKAIALLVEEEITTRIGAVHSFGQTIKETASNANARSIDYAQPILDVLITFVKNFEYIKDTAVEGGKSKITKLWEKKGNESRRERIKKLEISPEVQAALSLIGKLRYDVVKKRYTKLIEIIADLNKRLSPKGTTGILAHIVQIIDQKAKVQYEELLNQAMKCQFKKISQYRVDLRGVKIVKAELQGLNFSNTDFTGTDLSQVDLSGASLREANFTRATCIETNFSNANLIEAQFNDAILPDARFQSATLDGTYFNRAKLQRVFFLNPRLFINISFNEADLTDAKFNAATFVKVNFYKATLLNADLSGATFEKVNFVGADLTGAKFYNAEGIKFDQLKDALSLYRADGLPNEVVAELIKEKPRLFVNWRFLMITQILIFSNNIF